MKNRREEIRAVVLAAGKGTRLQPLTATVPKPLLPVGESVLIERTLERLAQVGVSSVAINLHHLGEQVRSQLGDSFAGMPITWSPEPELLGTLGALTNLREFLEPASLAVVVNGDSLCDWPLAEVVESHCAGDAMATLLVSVTADSDRFSGGISVDGARITSFQPPPDGPGPVFAGVQVISPGILQAVPEGPADTVRDLYQPALERGADISAHSTDRPWFDLGTPARYLEAVLATCAPAGGSVISSRATVERSARLERSVVLPAAHIGAGARLRRVVVGPRTEVPCDSVWDAVMLTRQHPGAELPAGSEVREALVVTPLGSV